MSDEQQEILTCCLCGHAIQHEMFPNGGYMGNNPAPLAPAGTRCCDWCNDLKVTPARMGLIGQAAEERGRQLIIVHAIQRHIMKEMKI